MDKEEIIIETEAASEIGAEETCVPVKVKKIRRWPTVVITAVITIFVTMIITSVLFFTTFDDALNVALRYKKLYEVETIIQENFIGDARFSDVIEGAAAGMVNGLGDQWSTYLSAEDLAAYDDSRSNSYVGIGVTVTKNTGEYILITDVNPSGGAYNAGIIPGDYIKSVDGIEIIDMELNDVTEIIKGEEGTFVNLILLRDDTEIEISVERLRVAEISVKYEMIDNVGYIEILNFYDNTADNFKLAVNDLLSQGATGLIFDVRYNGGGYLKELYSMLDFVLPEGVIFRTEDKDGNVYTQESDASCIDVPIAVLINDMSVSAAEYFAAVISEYNWGTLVGTNTLGKGYSQRLFYLSDGSAINLSSMRYFTPNGTCLAGIGLTPDIIVEIEDEEYVALYYDAVDCEDDTQLQAALKAVNN